LVCAIVVEPLDDGRNGVLGELFGYLTDRGQVNVPSRAIGLSS
jgi:hypothetical protein